MTSQTSIAELVELMRSAKPANEEERIALQREAYELAVRSEDGLDSINRIVYLPMILSVHTIAVELGIFTKLVETGKPTSADGLAETIKADPGLVNRILRDLASYSSLTQVDAKHYQANDTTRALANENRACGIIHSSMCHARTFAEFPGYLSQRQYQNPTDSNDTAFQKGQGITLPAFEWTMAQPYLTSLLMKFLSHQHRSYEFWSRDIDVRGLCKGSTAETPLFVDIGGGICHQCVEFKKRSTDIPGRVILQDQPFVVENSIPCGGVEKMAFDFWKPQPIKGARIYYFRMIIHDYPDEKCIELLNLTKAAMGPDSVVAMDDIYLPETGAHRHAVTMDINMMASLAAQERTEIEWVALLSKAGFKITEVKTYVLDSAASIIIAVPV